MAVDDIKITYVLYEGKHDAAILTRLLREFNYSNYTDKKIKIFPSAIKGFLKSKISDFVYEDENNLYQKPQLPNAICKSESENKWFLFYEMGGDSKEEYVKKFIGSIAKQKSAFSEEQSFETDRLVSLALFFDADNSLDSRKEKFIKSYTDVLPSFCANVTAATSHEIAMAGTEDGFSRVGLYIYGSVAGTGTLEDIVIPLMENGYSTIFSEADTFLNNQMTPKAYANSSKKGKALIGVVGQVKHHGKANQVVLSDTKMISKSKFEAEAVFMDILSFFEAF